MLAELGWSGSQIEEAILTLERLARGRGRRRGRPPAWLKDPANASLMLEEGLLTTINGNGHNGEFKRRGRPPGSKSKPAAAAATAEV